MGKQAGAGSRSFTEIRVHGIGDHEYYTSLGRPVEKRLNAWVQVAAPPPLPEHRLRIVNWSRSRRRKTGFLWYLAFPFTLANVAGRMQPVGTGAAPAALLRAVVGVVAVVLTVSQLAWLIILGETILRYLNPAPSALRAVPLVAAALLIAWLAHRYRTVVDVQPGQRGSRVVVVPLIHAAVVLCTGVLLGIAPPAQLIHGGWPSTPTPGGPPRLDAMALWIALSIGITFAAALILAVRANSGSRDGRSSNAPLAAAGVLLAVSVPLMHAVTALVRMVLDNLLGYVTGLFGWVRAPQPHSGILLPYDIPADPGDSRLDLFPFLALIAAAAVLLTITVVLATAAGPGLPPLTSGKAARGRWWHSVSTHAPRLLPRILPLALVLSLAAMAAAITLGEGRLGGPWLALAILLLQIAGAIVVLVVLLGQLRALREVLGKIADVAGFWPVRDHPLAGSSYRDAAVDGISGLVGRNAAAEVVLVAHSQGSVLCAWLVAHAPVGNLRPHLVTAGSPLGSVYATFFPATFTPHLLGRVAAGTRTWTNYWRGTDPVGSPVPHATNRELPDPRDDGIVRGHSDYWTEPEIVTHVARLAPRRA
ncbi:hypothetical protein GCM10027404_29840 [Arthrobacter tumbae]|uniref:hypothetical protein n=1 Tax=Arthrobacter tumbae TaxID=163874 RepID=UPI0019578E7B|nr:hypothetical protein [Arthrobacter tumbae]MBM7783041.1 hypothetical protein [Arthrobacter tumbae]